MDCAEILHFNFETYKIWMQKFCRAIFPLNSLKNQQQMVNAEILHFNFDTYKIRMQKFCRAIFPLRLRGISMRLTENYKFGKTHFSLESVNNN